VSSVKGSEIWYWQQNNPPTSRHYQEEQLQTKCSHSQDCLYRVSQEECARLQEGVPYVTVYRYNPKHLCPKLNGYGDNGQRKLWYSGRSTHCTCQLKILSMPVLECRIILPQLRSRCICTSFRVTSGLGIHVMYSAWSPKGQLRYECECFCSSI
jgi:hypothetical protein